MRFRHWVPQCPVKLQNLQNAFLRCWFCGFDDFVEIVVVEVEVEVGMFVVVNAVGTGST